MDQGSHMPKDEDGEKEKEKEKEKDKVSKKKKLIQQSSFQIKPGHNILGVPVPRSSFVQQSTVAAPVTKSPLKLESTP